MNVSRPRRPTSFDVAALAGVSQSTVSRGLRDDPGVNCDTRQRICEAAAELHYAIDSKAAALRLGRSGKIAVVVLVPTAPSWDLNPFYFDLFRAVDVPAVARRYTLLVSFQAASEPFRLEFARGGDADGTIVNGSARNAPGWSFVAESVDTVGPIICWGARTDRLPTVRCDNEGGARMATAHLIGEGHSRIAFVGPGCRGHRAFEQRRAGYLATMADHGLVPLEVAEEATGVRFKQEVEAARAILADHPHVDAVFAAFDLIGLAVAQAFREAGLAVSDDRTVIGFDGIAGGAIGTFGLATVEQDVEAAGTMLVEGLLEIVAGEAPSHLVVPTRLRL